MDPSTILGTLVLSDLATPDDWRPYERFSLTVNPDGTRSLHTITHSPWGNLFRDVHQTVGADWRAVEGYGRLYAEGDYLGTIWRRVVGDKLYSDYWAPDGSVDRAEFPAPPNLILGYHPIAADAWKMNFYDLERGGRQPVLVHTVSILFNGGTLGHGVAHTTTAEYLGREMLSTPAGDFECDRFMWSNPSGDSLEIWRTGEQHLCAKLISHKRQIMYQLGELRMNPDSE